MYKKTLNREIKKRLIDNGDEFDPISPAIWDHIQKFSKLLMKSFRINGYSQRGKIKKFDALTQWRRRALRDSQCDYGTIESSRKLAAASVIIEMIIRGRIHGNNKRKVFETLKI